MNTLKRHRQPPSFVSFVKTRRQVMTFNPPRTNAFHKRQPDGQRRARRPRNTHPPYSTLHHDNYRTQSIESLPLIHFLRLYSKRFATQPRLERRWDFMEVSPSLHSKIQESLVLRVTPFILTTTKHGTTRVVSNHTENTFVTFRGRVLQSSTVTTTPAPRSSR